MAESSETTAGPGPAEQDAPDNTRMNHALWLGPLIAVPGLLSYFAFFSQWPLFRDFPWVNMAILAGAVALSWVGLRRAWSRGGWRVAAGIAGLSVSSLLSALLIAYCFFLSYQLPSQELAAHEGEVFPAVALASHDGSMIDLGVDLVGATQRTIVVFYRGHW